MPKKWRTQKKQYKDMLGKQEEILEITKEILEA